MYVFVSNTALVLSLPYSTDLFCKLGDVAQPTELCVLAVTVRTASVSQMTRSASEPTAIRPLRGYRLSSLAALVLVTATNMFSSILPVVYEISHTYTHIDREAATNISNRYGHVLQVAAASSDALLPLFYRYKEEEKVIPTTALSQTRDILSSTPFTPSGIWVKSSFPMAFWETLKVQCALPVTLKSPLVGRKQEKKTCMCDKTPAAISVGPAGLLHCSTYLASSVFR